MKGIRNMKDKVQMAIRVDSEVSLIELNEHLEGGWKVIHIGSIPSSFHSTQSASLAIIEGEV
jgi:hypothetical protein